MSVLSQHHGFNATPAMRAQADVAMIWEVHGVVER